ncbi:hypothetical protein HK405_014206 [Cladochytrium tenue]|nr:hypothetical protein HK405_014206 [Cladochytrium tenue]
MAISQSTTVALQLADDLDLSLLTTASALVKNMLQLVVNSTVDLANDYEMTSFVTQDGDAEQQVGVPVCHWAVLSHGRERLSSTGYLKHGAMEIDWQVVIKQQSSRRAASAIVVDGGDSQMQESFSEMLRKLAAAAERNKALSPPG